MNTSMSFENKEYKYVRMLKKIEVVTKELQKGAIHYLIAVLT